MTVIFILKLITSTFIHQKCPFTSGSHRIQCNRLFGSWREKWCELSVEQLSPKWLSSRFRQKDRSCIFSFNSKRCEEELEKHTYSFISDPYSYRLREWINFETDWGLLLHSHLPLVLLPPPSVTNTVLIRKFQWASSLSLKRESLPRIVMGICYTNNFGVSVLGCGLLDSCMHDWLKFEEWHPLTLSCGDQKPNGCFQVSPRENRGQRQLFIWFSICECISQFHILINPSHNQNLVDFR